MSEIQHTNDILAYVAFKNERFSFANLSMKFWIHELETHYSFLGVCFIPIKQQKVLLLFVLSRFNLRELFALY